MRSPSVDVSAAVVAVAVFVVVVVVVVVAAVAAVGENASALEEGLCLGLMTVSRARMRSANSCGDVMMLLLLLVL